MRRGGLFGDCERGAGLAFLRGIAAAATGAGGAAAVAVAEADFTCVGGGWPLALHRAVSGVGNLLPQCRQMRTLSIRFPIRRV